MRAALPINPGPAATPGSNDRRVGAPNHHQNSRETTGSGETIMVGTIHPPAPAADAATVTCVRDRLTGEMYRFVTAGREGVVAVHVDDLAEVVAEIIADYTDHLVAERDAFAEDLAHELNARGGTQSADQSVDDGWAA
jgi:hypothetical protein